MKQADEQVKLRDYILGEIGDDKNRSAIEERIMTDDDYFQQLTIVEEGLIQDYVDASLSETERIKFEKNFLVSEENRQRVRFARALRRYVNENAPAGATEQKRSFFDSLRPFFSSPVPAAFAILIVLGFAGYFVWKAVSVPASNDSEVLIALNKAYRAERPIESRITDLEYAPLKNTRSGTNNTGQIDKIQLDLAKTLALKAVAENPSAENLHNLGRIYLTEKSFDNAIEQFEKALKIAPKDAKIRNNLGAALMEKAKTKEAGRLENLTKALEEFASAIEADKNLPDAYFNQALAAQALNLPNQAKQAWQKYLELDSSSPWAEEARKNLEGIEISKAKNKTKDEILQEFLNARQNGDRERAWQTLNKSREMNIGKLIPQQLAFLFVEAKSQNDNDSAQAFLDALIYCGKLEEEKSGDLYWHDVAADYAVISDRRLLLLGQAQNALKKGYEVYGKGNYVEARRFFESSKRDFILSGNFAQSKFCDYWIGSSLFYANDIKENLAVYEELAEFCEKKNYTWLLSQAFARLGYSFSSMNQISDALIYTKKSLAIAKKLKDESAIKKFSLQIADNYKIVGRLDESILYLENILAFSPAELRWLDYETLSEFFFKKKFFNTATFFEEEAYARAVSDDLKVNQQVSSVNLAIISASKSEYAEAERFIADSLQIAHEFEESEIREKSIAYSNLQLAHIKRQAQKCDESLKYYNESINFYDSSEFGLDRYDAYKGRLLCYLAQENKPAFEEQLPVIFEMFEKYRVDISEEQNRISFFNYEQDIYDIAIDFAFAEKNYSAAFDYSEKSRSRSLLDLQKSISEVSITEDIPEIRFSKNTYEPLKLAQIQAEIPENVQLLQYTVLADKVLIWVITKNEISITKSDISSTKLQEMIFNYADLITKNNEPSDRENLSKELYRILITPAKDKLDSNREIFLIPDKFLFQLPFVTLFSERYLVEDYRISFAPSANVFVICSRKAKTIDEKSPETILSIGNPEFNRDFFDGLQTLPAAEKEAVESAGFYEKSLVVTKKDATKQRIRQNLENSDVVHFAGHYVVDNSSPLLSGFVLAGDDKVNSRLANYEIISENLPQTRLIVLSACQTGIEKFYNGEGLIGASRTFLAAGIPLVVASQWEVDSEAAAALMTDFHRRRKTEKLSTAEALRQTQLAMLKNDKYRQPYYWAAFISLGGYARF